MKKIILWRDTVIGVLVIVGVPLWIHFHHAHDYELLIIGIIFVAFFFVPPVYSAIFALIEETTADREATRLAEKIMSGKR